MDPFMNPTITLLTVDLPAACEAWRSRPLERVARVAPRGRIDCLLAKKELDGAKPAAQALVAAGPDQKRAAFDALAEDLAVAWLWDAPAAALGESLSAVAKLAGRSQLEFHLYAAQPAYPAELLDEPFVERPESQQGLFIWLSDPSVIKAGMSALARAKDLPAGSFRSADPVLWRDLVDGLTPIFHAARPGFTVAALVA
jgi:hypothetical protein